MNGDRRSNRIHWGWLVAGVAALLLPQFAAAQSMNLPFTVAGQNCTASLSISCGGGPVPTPVPTATLPGATPTATVSVPLSGCPAGGIMLNSPFPRATSYRGLTDQRFQKGRPTTYCIPVERAGVTLIKIAVPEISGYQCGKVKGTLFENVQAGTEGNSSDGVVNINWTLRTRNYSPIPVGIYVFTVEPAAQDTCIGSSLYEAYWYYQY